MLSCKFTMTNISHIAPLCPGNGGSAYNWIRSQFRANAFSLEAPACVPRVCSHWWVLLMRLVATFSRNTQRASWTEGSYFKYGLYTLAQNINMVWTKSHNLSTCSMFFRLYLKWEWSGYSVIELVASFVPSPPQRTQKFRGGRERARPLSTSSPFMYASVPLSWKKASNFVSYDSLLIIR